MHSDELAKAWTALQVQRRAAHAHDEPSPEAMEAALQGTLSEEERERVLDALLSQGRGDELRLLYTMRRAAEESITPARSTWRRPWPGWLTGAAAAALVIAAGVPIWQLQRDRLEGAADAAAYRSGSTDEVQLIAPASGHAWPAASTDSLRVLWHTVRDAVGYTVELLDSNGRVLASQSVRGDTTARFAAPDRGLSAAPVGWWVYASLSDSRRVRSELRLFEPDRP